MSVEIGKPAPEFTLNANGGESVSLSDFLGKTVVLYFYPKDDTPGCTKEACDFRDSWEQITDAGAVVLGVSGDSVPSHDKFRKKYSLPFTLLSDPQHKVSEAYGAWTQKTLYGRSSLGIERSTFVIGPDGKTKAIFRKVKVDGHIDEVLKAVEE
ncbi:MAG TPA: thioredoxin-dependent thiol peroxidase [Candidatus Eisenbacteria bacterium]|nr:thioredoxin-dependent thiol peroxidase [Candidatus Eisenbacteria bacterium]